MNSKLKDLQNKLLQDVGTAVAQYGFGPKPSGQSFYQKRPFGWAGFHLSFIPHKDDFDVTGDVGLRIDAVENLINEDNKLLSRSEKIKTATVGAELGNIERGKPLRWNVAADSDVKSATAGLTDALVRIGLPYIENCSNLDRALDLLSSNDSQSWLYSPFDDGRCKRAMVLAFVLGQYERLKPLIEQCESILTAKNDPGLRGFEKLAAKLRSMRAKSK